MPPDQPWLRPEMDEAGEAQPQPQRIITGLQGLLDPAEWVDADLAAEPASPPSAGPALDPDAHRNLRQMFATDAPVADPLAGLPSETGLGDALLGPGLRRARWIGLALVGVLLAGLLSGVDLLGPPPHGWPGVAQAYKTIEELPPGSVVLLDWAYDPATAGELDLAARPVLEHLLARETELVVVSQLPAGPATARRLLTAIRSELQAAGRLRPQAAAPPATGFLPGGAATLPLLGQAPTLGLPVDVEGRLTRDRAEMKTLEAQGPVLALVLSGRSEDVQRWLEQVQPLNGTPVIAVTGAGADPALRPFWDSGQLQGLVSGYAGGATYRRFLAAPASSQEEAQLRSQQIGHNWALLLLALVLLLGNIASLLARREP
ncbi:MAG: hypothetical protein D6790_17045 [Caldilineae bacterium]|nr:MAG: hypothetical protein D6790_17045 [Caldilineae bacterium]